MTATVIISGCRPVEATRSAEPEMEELPYAAELQAALESALEEGSGGQDLGISAAVIVPGFAAWEGTAGNSHPGVPLTSDMLFNVGSVVKTFEAVLALKLVEQDRLDLDLPLSTWLPEYPNIDSEISVRQLLNHSSGIFNVFEHPDFPWVGPSVEYEREWQISETIENFVAEPYGPPGYAQHYSSTNYLLLTEILEQIGSEPVPEQMRQEILEPLLLDETFASMGELPPEKFTVAHPWVDLDLDGILDDFSEEPYTWIASMTHPVLFTTPQDLAVWVNALYHDGTVLTDDLLQEMLEVPETQLADREGGKYGLGVVDFSEILGTRVIGHGGSTLGYSAAALYLPEFGISLVGAINTGESPERLANDLLTATWSELSRVIFKNQ
jgi:D-alanyl-D-alanine carboxypeptidase